MSSLFQKYNPIPSYIVGIEQVERNGELLYSVLEAKVKGGTFDITRTFQEVAIDALAAKVKNTAQVYLTITGDQVLTKGVAITGDTTAILEQAYPNFNIKDFYYDIAQGENSSFVSICRQEYVENCIETYHQAGIKISGFSLGAIQAVHVFPYVENSEINTQTAIVTVQNDLILNLIPISEEAEVQSLTNYTVGDTSVASDYMLALAVVLKRLSASTATLGNTTERNVVLQKAFREKQQFKNILLFGLGALLLALLVNFMIFSSVYSEWQELQSQVQLTLAQKEQVSKQAARVQKKESVVQSILQTGYSDSSYLIDQLLRQLPTTILLESLVYQPLTKGIRKDKPILVTTDQVAMQGVTTDKQAFTDWLKVLEEDSQVRTVVIENYGAAKSGKNNFEVLLSLISDVSEE